MEAVDQGQLLREAPLRLIAGRIRKARKHAELSLDQLAAEVGSSRQHLISLEKARHRPRATMLTRIATATGKPVDYFLVEEAGEPNPFPEAA